MSLLAFAASLRAGSHNALLLDLAVRHARALGEKVTVVPFAELVTPAFDQDAQAEGFPPGAERLRELLGQSSGLLLATPEYNFSFPGSLKNTIDWVSRYRPAPFAGKHAMLLSASPTMVGGNRGLWQLRQPLESLGVFVHPEMFSLARSGESVTDAGELRDEKLGVRLGVMVDRFVELVRRVG